MIYDLCENWYNYAYGKEDVWAEAFEFLASLDPDCEDKKYEIRGDEIFALVQSYDTRDITDCKIETHQKFIDIQTLLVGSERMFYGANSGLEICDEYNADNDVAFYKYDESKVIEYSLKPGAFMVFFPEEGHVPGVSLLSGSAPAKKVVIKIAAKLLK